MSLRRLIPLAVLAALIALAFATGWNRYLSLDTLRNHRAELAGFVAAHGAAAAALYVLSYALATALSLPGGVVLTLTGGFLFGTLLGAALTVVGATAGATVLFLLARTVLGDALRARAGDAVQKLAAGFRRDAFNYLLVLRLVPLFPFFIVNLVPAFIGVPTRTFVLATILGIVPGTLVYASVGAGIGRVFDDNAPFSLSSVLTPQILGGLAGLALLSLLPVAWRRLKKQN